ncbi:Aste57867_1284 [Aphanomyces stellatus]|uniref:Aste57867_1284 protein n=1 Tax=Aphanomyces stellatus TaxID=120398 RepID=A0A485K5X1_9STRA|nr:hypothetical protein As57867_001283 [Aphanomyces stellatus]VFT78503.1 Aste57867_1284 [Aphanomyces stellatus]
MPVVLYLYVMHLRHPSIKYRQPHLMVFTGFCCTFYCLGMPLTHVWSESIPAIVHVLVVFVCPSLATLSFLLGVSAVIVLHKITQLLVLHPSFSPDTIHQLMRYRWLLYPHVQRPTVVVASLVVTLPYFFITLSCPGILVAPTTAILRSPIYLSLSVVSLAEVSIVCVAATAISKHLEPVMDNFHLRQTYQKSIRIAGLLVGLSSLHLILDRLAGVSIAPNYFVRQILKSLAAHYIVYFHIYLPVRQLAKTDHAHRRRIVARSSVGNSLAHQLERYLDTHEGFDTFLAFCKLDFRTEELLAWQCIQAFKQDEIDNAAADRVLALCLAPHAPLASPSLTPLYGSDLVHRLAMRKTRDADIVGTAPPATFFDEYQSALLHFLATEFFPRFQTQSPAWQMYSRRRLSLEGLEKVLTMVTTKQASSTHPLPPREVSSLPQPPRGEETPSLPGRINVDAWDSIHPTSERS